MTSRVVERVVKSPVGVYGLFALPFLTLGMEKSVYDTVQSLQGIDPNVRPADRGGFPSGGASEFICLRFHTCTFALIRALIIPGETLDLPSFSLIPVQKVARRLTQSASQQQQQK